MAKGFWCLIPLVYWTILVFQASALTDESDVEALQALYTSLNSPEQLKHWKLGGGDPCDESWIGVECFGSSVIHLKLQGLELNGNLGSELEHLRNLKQLDLSWNNIEGPIPSNLAPNLTHLNLAGNKFSQNIPYSLDQMHHLRHLNLSHNTLSGPLGAVFSGLENLKEMDLSFNNFTGDLPTSFRSLTNLTGLFLESNHFTGSVVFLADIPLSDLNIEDNHFSGVIPEKFQAIRNLWIGSNNFDKVANYPPWRFPSDVMPTEQNISSPPATNLSAFESHPAQIKGEHIKKRPSTAGVVVMVSLVTLIAGCAALFIVVRRQHARRRTQQSLADCDGSARSQPLSTAHGMECSPMAAEGSPYVSAFSSSPMITPSRLPPVLTRTVKMSRRTSFPKARIPINAKLYTVGELQTATNSFSEENLLGEGSLGSVYRAELPDGMILAVKNINTVTLSIIEEEQFLDVIRNASRLRHPNIVSLIGYCMEHGQHLIVYEFIRNLSLEVALHCVTCRPMSWNLRLRIALGIARGLNYMHSSCMPPMAHSNLKAANILLDEELMPRISDCGLAILRPLTSNSVKLKASEMAIADSGYTAPGQIQSGIGNIKSDVYAYGVLLLELLTGRKPFDSSRPKAEQCLVKWASSRLHDSASLGQMVDPAIARTISSKSVSRYADIVSLCIQPEQEFRPSMTEIVEALMRLQQKPGAVDGTDDPFDPSFRSTNSRFLSSPTVSSYSV